MIKTTIKAYLNPTEDPDKVEKAIKNVFGDIELRHEKGRSEYLFSEIEDIDGLHEFRSKIAQDRIRDTIHRVFSRWADENLLSFGLNRQAAYKNHVSLNLSNEDPMGPIEVKIEGDIPQVISFLCRKH